jgi:hypothetical protein
LSCVGSQINAYLADFREIALEKVHQDQHAGIEFIYVLKSRLAWKVGSTLSISRAGDSCTSTRSYRMGIRVRGAKLTAR